MAITELPTNERTGFWIGPRQQLLERGRWLTVRAASPFVRRTFAIGQTTHLFDPHSI